MDSKDWENYKRKTRSFGVRIEYSLLHSDAFKTLHYVPSIKVLLWFYEKVRIKKVRGGRNHKRKYERLNSDICFLYEEAELRGLSRQQFSRALKELYSLGFIEIKKPGSGRRGDFTRFDVSERWRQFGDPNFKCPPYPKSHCWINYGFGSKRKLSTGKS